MKRAAIAVILAALLLTGCGAGASDTTEAPAAVTEYTGDSFTVTRQGRETRIVDTETGEQYTFITVRRKRAQTAAEAADRARMKTAASTDTLEILYAGGVIIVTVNATGETFCFESLQIKSQVPNRT